MCFTIRKGNVSVAVENQRISALAELAVPAIPAVPGRGIVLWQRHPLAMLNLRGPGDRAFRDGVRRVCGCELPSSPNSSNVCEEGEILTLGPNEWLLVADPDTRWSENMKIACATLTDVSHARVVVHVEGEKAREMLAKGCPVDLHAQRFPGGTCIQTSIAKIGVIIHKLHNENDIAIYAARSYAGSLWHWLTASAAEYGYHVVAR